jgi:hypothetical protein
MPLEHRALLQRLQAESSQSTLAQVAVLPMIMLISYVGLIIWFRRRGGYAAARLQVSTQSVER